MHDSPALDARPFRAPVERGPGHREADRGRGPARLARRRGAPGPRARARAVRDRHDLGRDSRGHGEDLPPDDPGRARLRDRRRPGGGPRRPGESGYSDARHPDTVAYGTTVQGDSTRRDFTCNALYLDPLDDTFEDPQGGLADLEARRLRCVGEPAERFREDGLRLLRLARFAAALDLEPDPATLAAARLSTEALRGVSPERVREELDAIFAKPGCSRALAILVDLDLLAFAIPELELRAHWKARERVFRHLPRAPGLALGLTAMLDDRTELAKALRPSRDLVREVAEIQEVARAAAGIDRAPRSERIRWMRSASFEAGVALARAKRLAEGEAVAFLDEASAERRRLGPGGLRPTPLVNAEDLSRLGVQAGPAFGQLLREAETRQLDGVDVTREEALAWLGRAAHEGGKTPRSAKETG
jgi:tRNA nucleotidyltransferase/poly(A) polymerase